MIKNKQSGFTLIEMSIVLIVISLILAGVLKTVGVQRQQLKRDETRQQLEIIREALIGFALTNGRLPCPDTGNDGIENPPDPANGTDCDVNEAFLPHVDIGVDRADTWGNRFRYRVRGTGNLRMTDALPALDGVSGAARADGAGANASFAMDNDGNIIIYDNDEAVGATLANNIPAIVLSYAENGGTQLNCGAGLSARELENCDDDVSFVSSFYSSVNGQEFDDLITWIPLTILKARMIEAALLP